MTSQGQLEIVDQATEDEIMVVWRSVLDYPKVHWSCPDCGLECRCQSHLERHVRCH